MALVKTVTAILSDKPIAADTETLLADCTEIDLDAAVQVEVEVAITYGATATAGATVRVWGAATTGVYTTDPIDEFPLAFTAGATKKISFQTRASPRFMKVSVLNEDPAVAASAVTVTATIQTVA
ncbi:MAG: hypothetical protein WC277_07880 [Bacilli bacterium]